MRFRLDKDLEKSASNGSLISTNGSNEATYLGPSSPHKILNLNSGQMPEWTDSPTIEGELRLTRELDGTDGRIMSIGTDGLVTVQGNMLLYENAVCISGTPSANTGPGAGSGGGVSITVYGTNDAGYVELSTGNAPSAMTNIFTLFFSSMSYPNGCAPIIFPGNAAAAAVSGTLFTTGNANDWTLLTDVTALNSFTTYIFYYIVKGF